MAGPRQQVLARARYEAVLDESVLHRGPAGVLCGQLAHLADIAGEGRLVVRVLPFAAEIMPPGPLSYLRFASPLPSVAVLPSPAGTSVVDDRDALKTCAGLLDRLRAQALPPAESARLITERAAVPHPGDGGKLGREEA